MNGSKFSQVVRTEPVRKELGGRRPSKNKTKQQQQQQQQQKSHTEERREPYDALERREPHKKKATIRERSHKKKGERH